MSSCVNTRNLGMDSKFYKRKKFFPSEIISRFPRLREDEPYVGVFNGRNVTVFDKSAMHNIYNEGNFGKGSLSKSAPTYDSTDGSLPRLLMQQQWENQKKWASTKDPEGEAHSAYDLHLKSVQKFLESTFSSDYSGSWKEWKASRKNTNENEPHTHEHGIVQLLDVLLSQSTSDHDIDECDTSDVLKSMVDDIIQSKQIKVPKLSTHDISNMVLVTETVEDIPDVFNISNVNVKLRKSIYVTEETLQLTLPEAFYLSFFIGCLKIFTLNGDEMSVTDLWKSFQEAERNFIERYITFHQYRAYGWTVKPGLKYGGDYLLYKIGPAYYHASFLIRIMDKKKKMTWNEFVALNRLVESCNKDLVLCEIFGPGNGEIQCCNNVNMLREVSILEMVSKRWIPSQERQVKQS